MSLRIVCCGLLSLWSWMASAAAPTNYYASAEGKRGMALRAALHEIINEHTTVPYDSTGFDTVDALRVLDENPSNTNEVLLLYARRAESKTNYSAVWNREHVWPESYWLNQVPARSDLRNLRAEDASVNASRGNKYFDVSNSFNGNFPAHPEAPLCTSDSDSWEPPSMMKGDIARVLFYMVVRYRGDRVNEPALFLTDATNQVGGSTNLMGRLTTLLRWHEEDPVDANEEAREEIIFTRFQHNRNPFVDRPEWVRAAFWPEMRIVRTGNEGTLSYGAEYSAAILEFAFQTPTGPWGPVGGSRMTNGNTIFVSFFFPPGEEAGYFRLRLP